MAGLRLPNPSAGQPDSESVRRAMMDDLGIQRIEELPLADGERGRGHHDHDYDRRGAARASAHRVQPVVDTSIGNIWRESGIFNDEDAREVAGLSDLGGARSYDNRSRISNMTGRILHNMSSRQTLPPHPELNSSVARHYHSRGLELPPTRRLTPVANPPISALGIVQHDDMPIQRLRSPLSLAQVRGMAPSTSQTRTVSTDTHHQQHNRDQTLDSHRPRVPTLNAGPTPPQRSTPTPPGASDGKLNILWKCVVRTTRSGHAENSNLSFHGAVSLDVLPKPSMGMFIIFVLNKEVDRMPLDRWHSHSSPAEEDSDRGSTTLVQFRRLNKRISSYPLNFPSNHHRNCFLAIVKALREGKYLDQAGNVVPTHTSGDITWGIMTKLRRSEIETQAPQQSGAISQRRPPAAPQPASAVRTSATTAPSSPIQIDSAPTQHLASLIVHDSPTGAHQDVPAVHSTTPQPSSRSSGRILPTPVTNTSNVVPTPPLTAVSQVSASSDLLIFGNSPPVASRARIGVPRDITEPNHQLSTMGQDSNPPGLVSRSPSMQSSDALGMNKGADLERSSSLGEQSEHDFAPSTSRVSNSQLDIPLLEDKPKDPRETALREIARNLMVVFALTGKSGRTKAEHAETAEEIRNGIREYYLRMGESNATTKENLALINDIIMNALEVPQSRQPSQQPQSRQPGTTTELGSSGTRIQYQPEEMMSLRESARAPKGFEEAAERLANYQLMHPYATQRRPRTDSEETSAEPQSSHVPLSSQISKSAQAFQWANNTTQPTKPIAESSTSNILPVHGLNKSMWAQDDVEIENPNAFTGPEYEKYWPKGSYLYELAQLDAQAQVNVCPDDIADYYFPSRDQMALVERESRVTAGEDDIASDAGSVISLPLSGKVKNLTTDLSRLSLSPPAETHVDESGHTDVLVGPQQSTKPGGQILESALIKVDENIQAGMQSKLVEFCSQGKLSIQPQHVTKVQPKQEPGNQARQPAPNEPCLRGLGASCHNDTGAQGPDAQARQPAPSEPRIRGLGASRHNDTGSQHASSGNFNFYSGSNRSRK
ncbi:hypothetical protein B0T17DRAFT_503349 [Bombardia bombarda]|uniref:Uncharacterized protein n=1 Tax=Bombardia bombarda TaxID=252184 RepID=A0AA39XMS4_9PEZI|nr:hypothetical protein B0T17DRAFT_503349 [Bombardia bombarda]